MNESLRPSSVFIVGCPRSGTTLLRDVLRSHPLICCAEETHFFRWSEPYGTPAFKRAMRSKVYQRHRSIDGISEQEFEELLEHSHDRAELWTNYMTLFATRKKPAATIWLDKSPQNVFGMNLAFDEMENAKFIHIVRNPLNVVASFLTNDTFPIKDLIGAANYWRESIAIVAAMKRIHPNRIFELTYESLTKDVANQLENLCTFLEVDSSAIRYPLKKIRPAHNPYKRLLNADQRSVVKKICGKWADHYGYVLEKSRRGR